jgi:hypothetical protein
MRYQDQSGQDWGDIIDFLTMYPEARRRVVRMLGNWKRPPSSVAAAYPRVQVPNHQSGYASVGTRSPDDRACRPFARCTLSSSGVNGASVPDTSM